MVIGPYEKKSITVDTIEYSVFVRKGHDYFTRDFPLAKEVLPKAIREIRQEVEGQLLREYPFPRFSLVETPIHFLAYHRPRSLSPETMQPEQALIPEMGLLLKSSEFALIRKIRPRPSPGGPTVFSEEDIEKMMFFRFVRSNFSGQSDRQAELRIRNEIISGRGVSLAKHTMGNWNSFDRDWNIFPCYFHFVNGFTPGKYPHFETILGHCLKNRLTRSQYMGFAMGGALYGAPLEDNDAVNIALARHDVERILTDYDLKLSAYDMLRLISEQFIVWMAARSGADEDTLLRYIDGFLESAGLPRFRSIHSLPRSKNSSISTPVPTLPCPRGNWICRGSRCSICEKKNGNSTRMSSSR